MKIQFSSLLTIVLLGLMLFSLPGSVQPASAYSICNSATFVADVTIPDGTYINPGAPFVKTWKLKNTGTCSWSPGYAVAYYDGEKMGYTGPSFIGRYVSPGQTVTVSMNLTAPTGGGTYRGYFKMQNATGISFGIGSAAMNPFWVEIRVLGPTTGAVAYDFIQNMCGGLWVYDGGPIPCPVNYNKLFYGYVLKVDNPIMENGLPAGAPALLTVPQNKWNGVIQGIFPLDGILKGDHFQATIGCQYGATSCSVMYQLDYGSGTGTNFVTIWKFKEQYDGLFYNVDIDLSQLAWVKDPRIVLSAYANGDASGDMPLWVSPRIVRNVQAPGGTPTPVPTVPGSPTLVPTPLSCADKAQFVTDVTIPDGTTLAPNQTFNKVWRLKNIGTCTWNTGYNLTFISGDNMGAGDTPLTQSVVPGATVDAGINMTAPSSLGHYRGYWELKNSSGFVFGIGAAFDHPWWVDINVAGTPVATVTPSPTAVVPTTATPTTSTPPTSTPLTSTPVTSTPPTATATVTPTSTATLPPTQTPSPTPTVPSMPGWSTYLNSAYGFSFQVPPGSIFGSVSSNAGLVYLPIVTAGTNLREKYVKVSVVEGAAVCQSPETGSSMPKSTPENITINGIQFLKETGQGAATSNYWDWTGYSTTKTVNNVNACISLTFYLHSINPGSVETPPPSYDPVSESAIFTSIMLTYGNH